MGPEAVETVRAAHGLCSVEPEAASHNTEVVRIGFRHGAKAKAFAAEGGKVDEADCAADGSLSFEPRAATRHTFGDHVVAFATGRKPRMASLRLGMVAMQYAQRTHCASLNHEPPRNTRLSSGRMAFATGRRPKCEL